MPDIIDDVLQDGLVPPLDRNLQLLHPSDPGRWSVLPIISDNISGSEAILKANATKHSLNARAINALIKDVL